MQNLAAIQLQGGVINQRRDYPGVNHGPLAARLALRDLRALGSPLARMSLTIAPGALERPPLPGDVFLLHWPRLGIERMVVRVTGIDTGTLGATEWRIEAVEDVFGMGQTVLTPTPPRLEEPPLEPLPPALVLAVEVPYWELARRLSRADLDYLTDTDTYVGALACRGRHGAVELAARHRRRERRSRGGGPGGLRALAHARPGAAGHRSRCRGRTGDGPGPARAPGGRRLRLPGRCAGAIREAVAILAFDATAGTVDLARGVLDTTPQMPIRPARGWWAWANGWPQRPPSARRASRCSSPPSRARPAPKGDAVLAANGAPLVLAGRQARPYPPGRIRLNGQREPAVVAGDLTLTWAHRDRTLQTAYLVHQDEGDIGPEPGTTYAVRLRDRNGTLVRSETASPATPGPGTWPAPPWRPASRATASPSRSRPSATGS
ncbi:MAG: hypothetical protein KatS3mg122_2148 [Caldimonas sp.]|nr:MAG: hypothetical protein KatS3mg122_2148 [Caldimonas sp.]